MAKVNLLSQEWCELVFEGRNKAYGAYRLRREHGRHLLWALAFVVGGIAVLLLAPLLYFGYQDRADRKATLESIANLSRLDEAEQLRQEELKAVATAVRPRMRVMKDAVKFAPTISAEATDDLNMGVDDLNSLREAAVAVVDVPDSLAEYLNETDMPLAQEALSPIEVVEEMPQFPGGTGALMRWLERNLSYPEYCIRKKIEGEVQVTFIVDKNGNVTEPRIAQQVHPFLDKEALLCVQKMPKWQPGRVGGRVSLVRVTIPVVFQLQ